MTIQLRCSISTRVRATRPLTHAETPGSPSAPIAKHSGPRIRASAPAHSFDRRTDDANLLVGPANNDKLHLRPCTSEWTAEAWVRYTGTGGLEEGHTYVNICGTEDEGLGLPIGMRGGWNFSLHSFTRPGTLHDGLYPAARFMGSPRGRDPNHDTSGLLLQNAKAGGWTSADPPRIKDNNWHHVAWQFRYRDQTHFFFLDGQLIRRVQLPLPNDLQGRVVNDAENVGVPFVVGGFIHSLDPPKLLAYGNFEGEIDEIRISSIMRYPGSGPAVNRSPRTAPGYLQSPLLSSILDRRRLWPRPLGVSRRTAARRADSGQQNRGSKRQANSGLREPAPRSVCLRHKRQYRPPPVPPQRSPAGRSLLVHCLRLSPETNIAPG